jgi:hypothetical protein
MLQFILYREVNVSITNKIHIWKVKDDFIENERHIKGTV